MKLLLDTHTLLWFLGGSDRLSARARDLIENPANIRLFSVAGAWEIAIEVSLGKLSLTAPFGELVPRQLHANAIGLLPIEPAHMAAIIELPFHHRDPTDRMIIAQASAEDAALVSADAALDAYAVRRIW